MKTLVVSLVLSVMLGMAFVSCGNIVGTANDADSAEVVDSVVDTLVVDTLVVDSVL